MSRSKNIARLMRRHGIGGRTMISQSIQGLS